VPVDAPITDPITHPTTVIIRPTQKIKRPASLPINCIVIDPRGNAAYTTGVST
jgi:hypothetical protein